MSKIPLDELEVKLELLKTIVNLDNLTTTQICKAINVNFELECDESDIILLHTPKIMTEIDMALITYRDII